MLTTTVVLQWSVALQFRQFRPRPPAPRMIDFICEQVWLDFDKYLSRGTTRVICSHGFATFSKKRRVAQLICTFFSTLSMHPTWAGIFGTDFQGRGAMIYDGQGRSGSRFRQSRNSRDQWKALNNLSLGTSLKSGESENMTGVVLIVILGGFGRICLKCRNILNKLT